MSDNEALERLSAELDDLSKVLDIASNIMHRSAITMHYFSRMELDRGKLDRMIADIETVVRCEERDALLEKVKALR